MSSEWPARRRSRPRPAAGSAMVPRRSRASPGRETARSSGNGLVGCSASARVPSVPCAVIAWPSHAPCASSCPPAPVSVEGQMRQLHRGLVAARVVAVVPRDVAQPHRAEHGDEPGTGTALPHRPVRRPVGAALERKGGILQDQPLDDQGAGQERRQRDLDLHMSDLGELRRRGPGGVGDAHVRHHERRPQRAMDGEAAIDDQRPPGRALEQIGGEAAVAVVTQGREQDGGRGHDEQDGGRDRDQSDLQRAHARQPRSRRAPCQALSLGLPALPHGRWMARGLLRFLCRALPSRRCRG